MARLGLFPIKVLESAAHRTQKQTCVHFLHSNYLELEDVTSQKFLKKKLSAYKGFIKSVNQKLLQKLLQHIACSAAITTALQVNLSLVR